jgi:hypothetical protein
VLCPRGVEPGDLIPDRLSSALHSRRLTAIATAIKRKGQKRYINNKNIPLHKKTPAKRKAFYHISIERFNIASL